MTRHEFLGALAAGPAAGVPRRSGGLAAGVHNIEAFGARGDARTDCTRAIQQAIDAAAKTGGIVFVPPGRWLCRGHLELRSGVHLAGAQLAPQSWEPQLGSILLPTEGRGAEDGPAFLEMRSSSSCSGLTIYYPEQRVENIVPYPWTFHIRANPADAKAISFDCTIENVTLINSYNGIRTGPTENGRHRIMSVHGCVLRRGILVDWTGDIGRIENVQFHSHFWAHPAFAGDWKTVYAYMQNNLEAFIFGRTDWEYVTNTFVFPARVGYRFIRTANGDCNGQFLGIGADACGTAVLVESIQPQGLLITNGEFNCHRVGASTQIIVERGSRGNVRLVNCGFWGPVEHNAVLRGDGFTSFSDCYFSNNNDSAGWSVVAEAGKVQIQNCTFDAVSKKRRPGNSFADADVRLQPPSVHIGAGVRHAVVRGNNGYYGVRVQNDAGARAVVADNEPWSESL